MLRYSCERFILNESVSVHFSCSMTPTRRVRKEGMHVQMPHPWFIEYWHKKPTYPLSANSLHWSEYRGLVHGLLSDAFTEFLEDGLTQSHSFLITRQKFSGRLDNC